LDESINKLYALLLKQCTTALRAEIKGDKDYQKEFHEFNVLWLFKKIKMILAGVDTKADSALTLLEQMLRFLMRQGLTKSDEDYLSRINFLF